MFSYIRSTSQILTLLLAEMHCKFPVEWPADWVCHIGTLTPCRGGCL